MDILVPHRQRKGKEQSMLRELSEGTEGWRGLRLRAVYKDASPVDFLHYFIVPMPGL